MADPRARSRVLAQTTRIGVAAIVNDALYAPSVPCAPETRTVQRPVAGTTNAWSVSVRPPTRETSDAGTISVPSGATSVTDADGNANTADKIAVTLSGTAVTGRDFLDDGTPAYTVSGTVYDSYEAMLNATGGKEPASGVECGQHCRCEVRPAE